MFLSRNCAFNFIYLFNIFNCYHAFSCQLISILNVIGCVGDSKASDDVRAPIPQTRGRITYGVGFGVVISNDVVFIYENL